MNKRVLVLFFLTIVFTALVQVPSGADFPVQDVKMFAKSDGQRIEPKILQYNQFENLLTEKTYTFGESPNIWVQKLSNGDILLYFRQEPDAPGRIMTFDFLIPGEVDGGRCWTHKYISRSSDLEDDLEVKYIPSSINMVADVSEGITFVEFGEWHRSIFVSLPGRFKDHPISLQKKVAKGSSGKIVVLPDKITLTLEFAQTDAEFEEGFVVFSDKRLIDIQNERSLKALIATDLNLVKMLRRDGWWYTTRVGDYKGSEENCYYYNPGFYPAENLISWYLQPSNRLFTDIVLSSLRAAVQEMPEEGYHRSQVIPLMFWRWYGLTNDYIDTRFATDASRFLIKCAKELGSPGARILATKLGDEFIRVDDDQKTKIGDGYFLHDYITPEPLGVNMHTSLNHALCEINYFLELYDMTPYTRFKDHAELMLIAIDETCDDWIKPNGDLWYAYFPESDSFGRNDYEELTLLDLKETQKLHQNIFGYSRLSIQKLLDSKEEFLSH